MVSSGMTILKYLEMENFKSYEGSVTLGPFRGFSAVVGPNGSGKSRYYDKPLQSDSILRLIHRQE